MRAPWLDRAGRFSGLKAATLVLVALPAILLAFQWTVFGLGPRPIREATHDTGDWAIRLVMITLAVTPFRRILDWSRLINIRRMLGLAALGYASGHLFLYFVDQNFELPTIVSEIAIRIYLTIGFAALVGLVALGVTSTDAAIKRLGRKWVTLHKLIYVIAALALVHDYLQTKLDVTKAVLLTGYYFWLMGFRIFRRFEPNAGPIFLAALAVGATAATAVVEAFWYAISTGVDPTRVLLADLDFSFEIRPAWWVLGAGLAVLLLQLVWRIFAPKKGRRKPVGGADGRLVASLSSEPG